MANPTLAGVPLRNRVIVAAGCHGADGETIVRTSRAGVAAITTKTIVAQAVGQPQHFRGHRSRAIMGGTLPPAVTASRGPL